MLFYWSYTLVNGFVLLIYVLLLNLCKVRSRIMLGQCSMLNQTLWYYTHIWTNFVKEVMGNLGTLHTHLCLLFHFDFNFLFFLFNRYLIFSKEKILGRQLSFRSFLRSVKNDNKIYLLHIICYLLQKMNTTNTVIAFLSLSNFPGHTGAETNDNFLPKIITTL